MAEGEAGLGGLEIRPIETHAECNQALALQKRIWGFDENDVVAPRLFTVFSRIGGSCLGVFQADGLVGYSLAFAAFKPDGKRYWHSHMAAVEPALQHRGIGRHLKLRQRADALAAGLDLIEWTFDPLQSRNAYFNIEKLGVDIEDYLPNFYGITSSELHGHLPTDRLVAAWHLESRRVQDRLAGRRSAAAPGELQIPVPSHISEVSREVAEQLQVAVRSSFVSAFEMGMSVARFERRSTGGGIYHLAL